ncbi:amino acid decarboxylase [Aquibacillus sediminis]|uniref:amino acid decarboxylase n=1 Tax=Aquibacillus sediminis TaxID=2574734 RepID=UPI0011098BEE|nr:amino acid decarboxylase [Aquibacillus sediminis]
MIDIQLEGKRAIIDVRLQALAGEHPGNDVINYIKKSPSDRDFEIHVPHKANPLLKKLEDIGMNVIRHKVKEDHYYLIITRKQITN